MAVILGADCKVYRNNGGSWGTPTWDEVTIVGDVNLNLEMEKAEATARQSGKVKQFEPTLLDLGLEFTLFRDQAHADLTALETAFTARTSIIMAAATGTITVPTVSYWKGEMKVSGFSEGQPINGLATIAVKMSPCYGSNVAAETIVT